MAVAVGPQDSGDSDVISSINTTPLVDVMLVLLIIFLITIPVVNTSIAVQLPKERVEARQSKPENIIISVDREGHAYWYDTRVDPPRALIDRLKTVSGMEPQPEVQIRGDVSATYEGVGRVLHACQAAGIAKVSFITEPPAQGR